MLEAYGLDTLNDLADRLGSKLSTVKNWRYRGATPIEQVMRTARETGRSLDWLFSGANEAESTPESPKENPYAWVDASKEIEKRDADSHLPPAPPAAQQPALWRPSTSKRPAQIPRTGELETEHDLAVAEREGPLTRPPVRPSTPHPNAHGVQADTKLQPSAPTHGAGRPLVLAVQVDDAGTRVEYEVLPRYLGWAAAAGVDTLWRRHETNEGLTAVGDMAFTAQWLRANFGAGADTLASIYINGIGMAPVLQHGDSVILDTAIKRVDFTGFYILRQRGVARVIKRIQVLYDGSLQMSDDPAGVKAESVPASYVDQLVVVGRVVWPRLG